MSSSAQAPSKSTLKGARKTTRTGTRKGSHQGAPSTKSAKSAKTAKSASKASTPPGPRIQVRRSGVHGRGVFALRDLKPGEVIIEYTGELISWEEALDRHPHDPSQPDHTFYFHIDGGRVIDANVGGNSARWINHSCNPNCESDETDEGRVFIKALRRIRAGEELNYSYGLTIDERYTPKVKKRFECRCGAAQCSGTMLAPKR